MCFFEHIENTQSPLYFFLQSYTFCIINETFGRMTEINTRIWVKIDQIVTDNWNKASSHHYFLRWLKTNFTFAFRVL